MVRLVKPIPGEAIEKLRERIDNKVTLHYFSYRYEWNDSDDEISEAGPDTIETIFCGMLGYQKDKNIHIAFILGKPYNSYLKKFDEESIVFRYGKGCASSGWAATTRSESILTGISIDDKLIWDGDFPEPPYPGGLGIISEHLEEIGEGILACFPDIPIRKKILAPPHSFSLVPGESLCSSEISLDGYKELEKYLIKLV